MTATIDEAVELLPGYRIDPASGAWVTLPWPADPDERQALASRSLGPAIIAWAEGRTDEPGLVDHLTGRPWRFTSGQKRFLVRWFEVRPDGRWRYRSGVKRGAKGPIAHDTLVPTPTGWIRHGDLAEGTQIIGGDGLPCTVLAVHPEVREDCYAVQFSDGETVVATGGHRWPVQYLGHRGYSDRIATTAEMAADLTRRDGARRWRQQVGAAVKLPEAELPLDPYVVGAWLGDGWTNGSEMAGIDREVIDAFEAAGFPVTVKPNGRNWRVRGLIQQLRGAGLLGNKHIPVQYLRASIDQRIALLQGMMDTDGSIDGRAGVAEFCNTNPVLIEGICELLSSLGIKFGCKESRAMLDGVDYGPRWRVTFTVFRDAVPLFRIRRKLDRQRFSGQTHGSGLSRTRQIVAIEQVPTVPARCITVDSSDHTYRVGRRMVSTCNTGKDPFCAAWLLCELLAPVLFDGWDGAGRPVGRRHRLPLVQISANSEAQAKDVLRVANAMLDHEARSWYGIDCGDTRTTIEGGGRLELLTASEASSEGDPSTAIGLNESHHMTETSGGHKLAEVARRNVGKSPAALQARLLEFTNAHQQGSDSVAERSFEAWQAQMTGEARRADILYDSIEAPPTTDLFDDASRMAGLAAAYSDAPWADLERLSDEVLDIRTSVADSIRYYLNGLAAAEDAWADPAKFDALARADLGVADGERIAMFLDCSKSGDATGLVGCRLEDGHVFVLGCWQAPRGPRGKGWLAPRAEVDAVVRGAFEQYRVCWFGVDPSPATDDEDGSLYWADLIQAWHTDFRRKLKLWATPGERTGNAVLFDMRLSAPGAVNRLREFTSQAMQTALAIDEDATLTHDGDTRLRLHVHQAKARPNLWGTSLGKVTRDSSKLIDLAVCMVGARLGRRLVLSSGKVRRSRTAGKVVIMS